MVRAVLDRPETTVDDLSQSLAGSETLDDVMSFADEKITESGGDARAALQALIRQGDVVEGRECSETIHAVLDDYLRDESEESKYEATVVYQPGAPAARAVPKDSTPPEPAEPFMPLAAGPEQKATVDYEPDAAAADAVQKDSAPLEFVETYIPPTTEPEYEATVDYQNGVPAADPSLLGGKAFVSPQHTRTRYLLTRMEGAGGLGQVWRARDPLLRREVALKENIPGKGTPEDTQRLVKEAQITGLLEHPNIISVYELGHRTGKSDPFYTMPLLKDETLTVYVTRFHESRKENGLDAMELRRLLDSFVGVCNALAYAHDRGVMHRDLKPSNVMMGGFGEVIVLDWGLATYIADREDDITVPDTGSMGPEDGLKTRDGQVLGTPAYMAPEQALGRRSQMGVATDVYGLGGILFAILAGLPPNVRTKEGSTHRGTGAMLSCIGRGEIPEPRDLETWVPRPLNAICRKALALDPVDRYLTAAELADDVRRWLADEPVSCFAEPFSVKALRWMRRHRAWATAIATVLIVVSVTATVSTLIVNKAREAEAEARGAAEQSLEAEQLARAESVRRFREARSAVDRSLSEVSDVLAYFPRAQQARARLLEEAAADYERFTNEHSEIPEIQAEAANALVRLGDVRKSLGQIDNAETAYRSSIERYETLLQLEPNKAQNQKRISESQVRLATLFSDADVRSDESQELFDAAVSRFRTLYKASPDDPGILESLGAALVNNARLLIRRGEHESAHVKLEEAGLVFQERADKSGDAKARLDLAETRHTVGQLLLATGKARQAMAELRDSVSAFRMLVDESPDDPARIEGLAGSRVDLANTLVQLGQDNEAFEAYSQSVEDFELLLEFRPGVPDFRANLAVAHTNLAQILFRYGAPGKARQQCESGLEILNDLIILYRTVGRFREAHASNSSLYGLILRDQDEDEFAIQALNGAAQGFLELSENRPDFPDFRRRLAVSMSALARTHDKLQEEDLAAQYFQESERLLNTLLMENPDDSYSLDALAWTHLHIGTMLTRQGKTLEASTHFAKALEQRNRLTTEGASAEYLHNLSWFLTMCPDVKYRNASRAVAIANQARTDSPDNARYWGMLALARLRDGDYSACVEAIAIAESLRPVPDPIDSFTLAMALWKQGNQADARETLKQAQVLMDAERPGNPERLLLRAEAEELILRTDAQP